MSGETVQESVELKHILASLTEQFKFLEEELTRLDHDSGETDKEFTFIHELVNLLSRSDLSMTEGIQEILDLIPPLWQYPDETCGRIKIRDLEFKTTNFIVETKWKHSAAIIVQGESVGEFEIFYNEGRPEGYRGVLIWEDHRLVEIAACGIALFLELEEARNHIISLAEDLEVARRAAKEYESQFYNYAARIKALKSRADESVHALKVGMRNIGSSMFIPLKAIHDLSRELQELTENDEITGRADKIGNLSGDIIRLAGNIIDYVNLETGYFRQNKNPFSLRGAIDSTTEQLIEFSRNKGLEIISYIDPIIPDGVLGDDKRLRQIIENLVREAVLSSKSGEIIIRAEMEVWAHLLPIFHFSVSSTERVISENQKTRLFEIFNCDEDDPEAGQLGVAYGLAVAKNLVELMGGEMWVESPAYITDDGSPGSAIHFTLWMDIQKSQEDSHWGPMVTEEKGLSVLVVDDRVTNRKMLSSALENWGWRVETATGGKETIDKLVRERERNRFFDLILLDVELPDMHGKELVRKVAQNTDEKLNTVVLLSYDDNPLESENQSEFGVRAIIKKPVKQQELYHLIKQLEEEKKPAGSPEEKSGESQPLTTASRESRNEAALAANSILFSSHDRLIQLLYKGILEKRGYRVIFAENPEDIPDMSLSGRYAALLFDLTGASRRLVDAIQIIRERDNENQQHTLLLGIMNSEIPGRCEKFVEAGLDDCIVSGNDYDELYECIEKHLKDNAAEARGKKPEESLKAEVRFDPEKALAAVEGDHDLMYEIIDAFEEEGEKYISSLERSLDSRDRDEIEKVVNTLIGISERFGVSEIGETAEIIQKVVNEDNYDEARRKMALLSAQMNNLEKQLSKFEENLVR